MKRPVCILCMGFLLLAFTACTHKSTVTDSSSVVASFTAATASAEPTEEAAQVYSPHTLTPSQGGNMLYPTYYKFPDEILSGYAAYVSEVMGIINQDGRVIASPQYVSFVYYKNAEGRIQYVIVTGSGKATVYNLDGSVYMEFEAERVTAINGFPFLEVGLHTYNSGPGSEPGNSFTVYDLRTGKKALDQNYNEITFIDSHTALLQNYGKFEYDKFEFIDSYLYDFNGKPPKAVKMNGFIEDFSFLPPFKDTVTRIPATDLYVFPGNEEPPGMKHGYLDRSGRWVKKSEESSGVKPAENEDQDAEAYYCQDLNEKKSFENRYFWVIEGDYQGYQDKDGTWLFRENSKSPFLED